MTSTLFTFLQVASPAVDLSSFIGIGLRILAAVVLLGLALLAYKLLKKPLMERFTRQRFPLNFSLFLLLAFKLLLGLLAFLAAFGVLGGDLLAALLGLAVVIILGAWLARDSLENLAAGIALQLDRPFFPGDYIEIGRQFGQVTEAGLHDTRLKDSKGEMLIIPNQRLVKRRIINHSAKGAVRVEVPCTISFMEDIGKAREVLLSCLEGDEHVKPEPKAEVVVKQISPGLVALELWFYTDQAGKERRLSYEYLEKCFLALDEANVPMPAGHPERLQEKHGMRLEKKEKASHEKADID